MDRGNAHEAWPTRQISKIQRHVGRPTLRDAPRRKDWQAMLVEKNLDELPLKIFS